jgi:hypothetical protein
VSEIAIASAVDRERLRGRLGGVAALASVAAWIVALQFANAKAEATGAVLPSPYGTLPQVNHARQLETFNTGLSNQAFATGFRCLGLLLTALVAWYLFSIVRRRRESVSPVMLWAGVAGCVLVAGATVFGFFALKPIAAHFMASGPRTSARAQHLLDASSRLRVAAVADLLSRIVFAFWVGVASVQLMRVELLDRFLAYWGFGACIGLVLLPIGDAMFIGWLGSLGVIALGYWPGGRPPGWTRSS